MTVVDEDSHLGVHQQDVLQQKSEISTLTDSQEKILALLPIIPTLLSILGSSTIISMVLKSYYTKGKRTTPYKRLLFGMSVCDIIGSISVPFWSFLLPKDTNQRIWAMGNDATCTMIGFMAQFYFSAICYNGMLTYYFLFTVRFGWKDETIARYVEPILHMISIGYPLITAIVGAILDVYHEGELGPSCWVTNYPENCGSDPGETGEPCLGPIIAWIFGGTIIFFVILSIIINNLIIYCYVRRTISRGQRYQPHQECRRSSSSIFMRRRGSSSSNSSYQRGQQAKRIQAVATQALLYVGAFLLSYIWTIILKIMEGTTYDAEDEATLYPFLVLHSLFMPIHGFFNLLVYARPNYLRSRTNFPSESYWWCFQRAIYGESITPRSSTSDHRRQSHPIQPNYSSTSTTVRGGPATGINHPHHRFIVESPTGSTIAFFVPPDQQSTSLWTPRSPRGYGGGAGGVSCSRSSNSVSFSIAEYPLLQSLQDSEESDEYEYGHEEAEDMEQHSNPIVNYYREEEEDDDQEQPSNKNPNFDTPSLSPDSANDNVKPSLPAEPKNAIVDESLPPPLHTLPHHDDDDQEQPSYHHDQHRRLKPFTITCERSSAPSPVEDENAIDKSPSTTTTATATPTSPMKVIMRIDMDGVPAQIPFLNNPQFNE